MTVLRMDNVGIVVDDLEAATAFFVELGLELEVEMPVERPWVDRLVGLDGVRYDIAMLRTRRAVVPPRTSTISSPRPAPGATSPTTSKSVRAFAAGVALEDPTCRAVDAVQLMDVGGRAPASP